MVILVCRQGCLFTIFFGSFLHLSWLVWRSHLMLPLRFVFPCSSSLLSWSFYFCFMVCRIYEMVLDSRIHATCCRNGPHISNMSRHVHVSQYILYCWIAWADTSLVIFTRLSPRSFLSSLFWFGWNWCNG